MTEVDSILNNWFGEPPEHSDNERAQLKFLYEPLRKIEAERDALLTVFRESLRHAEWCDKHIYPFDGETFQNWKLSIYLPVRLSETDKSPEAALDRLLKE